jgi:hypothetical protein
MCFFVLRQTLVNVLMWWGSDRDRYMQSFLWWTLSYQMVLSFICTQYFLNKLLLLLRTKGPLVKIIVLFATINLFLINLEEFWLIYDFRRHKVPLGCICQSLGIIGGIFILNIWELIVSNSCTFFTFLSHYYSLLLIDKLSDTVTLMQYLPLVVLAGVIGRAAKTVILLLLLPWHSLVIIV